MPPLSPQGVKIIEYVAQRHGVSTNAVIALLAAMTKGNGRMAQFDHPELGGFGQWSEGGMVMIGEMQNRTLKSRVEELCTELSELLRCEPAESNIFLNGEADEASDWWGVDFGPVNASGSQNDVSYAYSRSRRVLAIKTGQQVALYDTGEHDITGISQQGGDSSLVFTSQKGSVRLQDLRALSGNLKEPNNAIALGNTLADDIFLKLERLADLKDRGVISEDDFAAKKKELLERI